VEHHNVHLGHEHSGPDHKVGGFRVELIIALLLGLAAITGALAAYSGHVTEGHAVAKYNEAVQGLVSSTYNATQSLNNSNFFYVQGNQVLQHNQALFLEYVKAARGKDTSLAVYIQKTLMSDALKKQLNWWTTGSNTTKYPSPFVAEDPYFTIPEYTQGAKLDKETTNIFKKGQKEVAAIFKEGRHDEHKSNGYTLVEVLIASALFFYGLAGVTHRLSIKLGFLGFGILLFVASVSQLIRTKYL
jgi:hypothetical protein